MFERHLRTELLEAVATMPAVTLVGPRQSGKTTLVKETLPDHGYISLERPDILARALDDPLAFLDGLPPLAILDEVQRAPDLLSYLQVRIDDDPRPGRFVLTGSQNLLLMERVSQSLAGRTRVLHLLPLSASELFGRPQIDPPRLDRVDRVIESLPRDRWQVLVAGFYPRIHDRDLRPDSWLGDYRRTFVERDLRQVLKVMDLASFDRFLRLVAARTGQVLNLSDLAADVGISQPTARQWLTALEVAFLVTLLPAHHANFRKRVRRRPKLHFLDTGLACHLLGIRDAETLAVHPLRGALFESFVVSELCKAYLNRGLDPPLYHWRDAAGHEIDVVIDLENELLPLEVKSGVTVPPDAVRALSWWVNLEGNPASRGLLVHGGCDTFSLRGFRVLPWHLS